jgi:hypothetical protein
VANRNNRKTANSSSLQAVSRQFIRPTWAEISLAALRANFRAVWNPVGESVAVCAVVRAAYGYTAAARHCTLQLARRDEQLPRTVHYRAAERGEPSFRCSTSLGVYYSGFPEEVDNLSGLALIPRSRLSTVAWSFVAVTRSRMFRAYTATN